MSINLFDFLVLIFALFVSVFGKNIVGKIVGSNDSGDIKWLALFRAGLGKFAHPPKKKLFQTLENEKK